MSNRNHIFSIQAMDKFKEPERRHYFNDTDYLAACKRVNEKRILYDKANKFNVTKKESTQKIPVLRNVEVRVHGVVYKNYKEAAKALNISPPTVSSRCKNDNFPEYRLIK